MTGLRYKVSAGRLAYLGCTIEQWIKLRDAGLEMIAAGTCSTESAPIRAYCHQRHSAEHRRNIPWRLTLLQWWDIWSASGHWPDRGTGRGYMMCRKGDLGAYEIGNVFIGPGVENLSAAAKKCDLPIGVAKKSGRVAKKSAEVVENADALVDEIFAEISAPRAPRATRVETIDEFDPETGEITESDLAETRPDGRGKAESASGEAPDTAPQKSTAALMEVHDRKMGAEGSAEPKVEATAPPETLAYASPMPAGTQALPVDTAPPTVPRAERHNDDPRCLDKAKCGAMSNFAFCIKCRAAWREQHPLEAA